MDATDTPAAECDSKTNSDIQIEVVEPAVEVNEAAAVEETVEQAIAVEEVMKDDKAAQVQEPSPPPESDLALKRIATRDSDTEDNRLKRKMADRVPSSSGDPSTSSSTTDTSKRARDDAEPDDNPRERKRPSPPPEGKAKPEDVDAPAPKMVSFVEFNQNIC